MHVGKASSGQLIVASAMAWSCAETSPSRLPTSTGPKPEALAIREQGSFAVGGTVVKSPGTFDPYKPTADGATLHGDHAYVFYLS
jgi:hypothetical protein